MCTLLSQTVSRNSLEKCCRGKIFCQHVISLHNDPGSDTLESGHFASVCTRMLQKGHFLSEALLTDTASIVPLIIAMLHAYYASLLK